jgi:hypothetical protein
MDNSKGSVQSILTNIRSKKEKINNVCLPQMGWSGATTPFINVPRIVVNDVPQILEVKPVLVPAQQVEVAPKNQK